MDAISTSGEKRLQHLVDALRILAIALRMPVDEDGLRAEFGRGAQRHGRMHAELARRVGSRRYHPALVATPADHDRLAFECWIEQLFHGHEEGVHVDMEESFHGADTYVTGYRGF